MGGQFRQQLHVFEVFLLYRNVSTQRAHDFSYIEIPCTRVLSAHGIFARMFDKTFWPGLLKNITVSATVRSAHVATALGSYSRLVESL